MRLRYIIRCLLMGGILAVLWVAPAWAAPLGHDQPDGADWIMADWMLYSFLIFFVAALLTFLVALKRGMFHNLEDAKYYILSIDEKDYYTPDWAKEE